jgi:hypothetical protein
VAALLLAAGTGTSAAQDAPPPDPAQVQQVLSATSYIDLARQIAILVETDPNNPLLAVMRARLVVLLDAEIARISAITSPALLREELARLQAVLPGDPLVEIVSAQIVTVSQPPTPTPTRVAFVDTNPY